MRTRLAAGLAASLVIGLLSVGAQAATPKVCNLVPDPAGDDYQYRTAYDNGVPTAVHDASLDLTGGDIASSATAVTFIFKVSKLSRPPSSSPQGERFYAEMIPTTSSDTLYVEGDVTKAGATFYAGYLGTNLQVTQVRPQLGAATGIVDSAKNEVRITAPLAVFKGHGTFTAKTKLTTLKFWTGRIAASANAVTGNAVAPFADNADGLKSYTHLTPSCVKVGK